MGYITPVPPVAFAYTLCVDAIEPSSSDQTIKNYNKLSFGLNT